MILGPPVPWFSKVSLEKVTYDRLLPRPTEFSGHGNEIASASVSLRQWLSPRLKGCLPSRRSTA
eukprot:561295-Rhodomonas_salina.1